MGMMQEILLKGFAEILGANTRKCDICGRIGGDEFLLVIGHSDEEGIRLAIERLRERVETQEFLFGGHNVRITASFGVAGLQRRTNQKFEHVVVQADVALHSAKRFGRNRVEMVPAEVHLG